MTKLAYLLLLGLLLAIEIGFLKMSKKIKSYKAIGSTILILVLVIIVVFRYQQLDKESLRKLPKIIKNNQVYQLYQFLDQLLSSKNKAKIIPARHQSHYSRKVSPGTKKVVAAEQEWKCGHCQQLLKASYEIDHIKPLFKGGSNDRSNLMALCRNCHGEKTLLEQVS